MKEAVGSKETMRFLYLFPILFDAFLVSKNKAKICMLNFYNCFPTGIFPEENSVRLCRLSKRKKFPNNKKTCEEFTSQVRCEKFSSLYAKLLFPLFKLVIIPL